MQATSGRPPERCQLPTRPQDARRCLSVPNICCYAPVAEDRFLALHSRLRGKHRARKLKAALHTAS